MVLIKRETVLVVVVVVPLRLFVVVPLLLFLVVVPLLLLAG